jgi:hypothetical protein
MNENSVPTARRAPFDKRSGEIDKFLERLEASPKAATGAGRLIFALDATASRAPTWDTACRIQAEMFEATATLGQLDVQLVFYRGYNECKASRRLAFAADLHRAMRSVSCVGGHTQIERVLAHAIAETKRQKVSALVFVGDAMEEPIDRLCELAGVLGRIGVPVFMFHENRDPTAATAFKQIASLSRGAYVPFDLTSAERLKVLLGAVAVFATGGQQALEDYGRKHGGEVLRLTSQLRARP